MRKKYLSALLFGVLLVTSTGTFTSCKDYDDEISNLQSQVDGINVTLEQLQKLVDAGSVITSVEKITDGNGGIKITLSDGKSYDILNGSDGTDGQNASVWTIGEDGYWYKDGSKTDYKALGQNGTDGTNGMYYVPNVETGCFDIYQDGKLVEATQISWKADGVSVIKNGNKLTFVGVQLADGTKTNVEISLGAALGSVAFVPEKISSSLPYPTTTNEFLHIETSFDEEKYSVNGDFIGIDFDKSNTVDMIYRLNPTDAYVEDATIGFINRVVSTRAIDGDKTDLLNVVDKKINDGSVTIESSVNPTKLADNTIAALQVYSGQNPVTSDYVHITSNPIDVVIADTTQTVVGSDAVIFYPRTKVINDKFEETSDYIQNFVKLSDDSNFELVYTGELNLKDKVGLYSNDKDNYITKLGFSGMKYKFSLPEEYLSNDTQKTNQQWFVELKDGVLTVNSNNLTEGLTPAIGRTPVVRVDAFIVDNYGVEKLVGSSYIKVSIVKEPSVEVEDKDPIESLIGTTKYYEYHALSNNYITISNKPWTEINNDIYGKTGLTSESFWKYYGGEEGKYSIELSVVDKNGANKILVSDNTNTAEQYYYYQQGVGMEVQMQDNATTTANILVSLNNQILTENTYKDVDSKGAEYTFKITIPSNDKKTRGDVVLTQKFYVKEDCKEFEYNPLYHANDYKNNGAGDYIIVKGQLNDNNNWELSTAINEHFVRVDNANIFEYFNTINNVSDLTFNWASGVVGVKPTTGIDENNDVVALDGALSDPYVIKEMTYSTTLVNGETCDFSYNIVFENPFVEGKTTSVSLTDKPGESTVSVEPSVIVNDTYGDIIYSWNNTSNRLELSQIANSTYKVAEPSVTYEFVKNDAYNEITNNMSADSKLEVSNDGVVTWVNQGSLLQKNYSLIVKATVTFKDLSIVSMEIPVNLLKK